MSSPSSSSSSSPSSRTSSIDSRQGLRFLVDYPRGSRPVYSHHTLVRGALLDSSSRPLTANQVWDAICRRFSFFKTERGSQCRAYIMNTLSNTPCFCPVVSGISSEELYWAYDPNQDIHRTNDGSPNTSITTLVTLHIRRSKGANSDTSSEASRDVEKGKMRSRDLAMSEVPPGDMFQELDLGVEMHEAPVIGDRKPLGRTPSQKDDKNDLTREQSNRPRWSRGRSTRRHKASVEGIPFPEILGDSYVSRLSSQHSHERLPYHPASNNSVSNLSRSNSRVRERQSSNPSHQHPEHRTRHRATVARRSDDSSARVPPFPQQPQRQHRNPLSNSKFIQHQHVHSYDSSSTQHIIPERAHDQSPSSTSTGSKSKPVYAFAHGGRLGSSGAPGGIGEDVDPEVEKRRRERVKAGGYGSGFGYEQRVDEKESCSIPALKEMRLRSLGWRSVKKQKQDGCCVIA